MYFHKILFIKYKFYLIIPIICLFFWALLALVKDNFIINPIDYSAYYYAGKNIFLSPDQVYLIPHPSYYYYLPSFASIFSIFTGASADDAHWVRVGAGLGAWDLRLRS